MGDSPARRVLISYAHESPERDARVEHLYELLRENGVDAQLDVIAAEEPQDWVLWMTDEIRRAEQVLVIVSPVYKRRFERTGQTGEGLGVQWEGRLIRNSIYRDQAGGQAKFLPVLLPGADVEDIPDVFQPDGGTHYRVDDFTVAGAERLLRLLTRQPARIAPDLGPVPHLPPIRRTPHVVLRLSITGASPAVRDAIVHSAIRLAAERAETARVELDEDGEVCGALVVTAADTAAEVVGVGIRAVRERVRTAAPSAAGLQVRIGVDLDRFGPLQVGQVAGRLAQCRAARAMHRVPGAHLVIAASHAFHSHVAEAVWQFPAATSYAEWPKDGIGGDTCWISVPGRAVCPPLPPEPPTPAHDETGAAPTRYLLPHNRGTVTIVEQGDHGVVNIRRAGHGDVRS